MTQNEALALAETKWWETRSHREIAEFQMNEPLLCCPFSIFHEAMEKTLGRPVFTHEFGLDFEGLKKELMGERPAPSFDEILGLIPKNKQVVVMHAETREVSDG